MISRLEKMRQPKDLVKAEENDKLDTELESLSDYETIEELEELLEVTEYKKLAKKIRTHANGEALLTIGVAAFLRVQA